VLRNLTVSYLPTERSLFYLEKMMPYKNKKEQEQYFKEYYQKNKDKILLKNKIYRKNNRKKILSQKKEYWLKNKNNIIECAKIYYEKNKEHILKQCKGYRENNKEHYSEYNKKYRIKNKERIKERLEKNKKYIFGYMKKWRKYNRNNLMVYAKIYNKSWRRTEKGKACIQRGSNKRRARERDIINTLTAKEWIDILKQYKFRCAYCGKEFNLFDRPERDHIIPVSKGGNNIKENVVPACRRCNARKSDKIL